MADDDDDSKVFRLFPEKPDPEANRPRVERSEPVEGGTRIVIFVPDKPAAR